ncbi:hypothetical protein JW949_01520 [Candidatus Woesearchaeota archaeon]|nr:hypothetical protein [Candidatus Woesearchaeota archaeon]
MALKNITNIQGDLKEIFPKFKIPTIQHSDEISKDRLDDKTLIDEYFYTADHGFYDKIQGKKAMLHLGRCHTNPIFKHIEEAYNQLINNHNYLPSEEDIESILDDKSTLTTELSALNLEIINDEYGCFKVNTSNPFKELNSEQIKVLERAFGRGQYFQEHLIHLRQLFIDKIDLIFLTENYVEKHTENNKGISRVCGLRSFLYLPGFFASGHLINSEYCLRGCLKSPKATTQKK